MGVDEANTKEAKKRRSEAAEHLMKIAENKEEDLLEKIGNLCLRGAEIKTPIRMEILELKGKPFKWSRNDKETS